MRRLLRFRGQHNRDRGGTRGRTEGIGGRGNIVNEKAEEGGEKEVEEGQLRMERIRKHVGLDITL